MTDDTIQPDNPSPDSPAGEFTSTVSGRVYFDASLRPQRSLSYTGFVLLMFVAGLIGFTIGIACMMAGAWPVFGFCGLEFLILYIAFKLNYRSGRWAERIVLSDAGLEVQRFGPRGQVGQWAFEPYWLRITMDDPPQRGSTLTLSSHGKSLDIGGFLTPEERVEVANALRDAIEVYRSAPHLRASEGG